MRSNDSYSADPATTDAPLSLEEVEAVLEADIKPLSKNPRALQHFVHRVVVTMRAYRRQIQALHRDVQAANIERMRAGAPTTLHPRDAFKYLSYEEQMAVVDGSLRDKLGAVQRAHKDAHAAQQHAYQLLNQLRYAASTLSEDESIPAALRQRFEKLLTELPEVDEPAPDPEQAPEVGPAGEDRPDSGGATQSADAEQGGEQDTESEPPMGDDLDQLFG